MRVTTIINVDNFKDRMGRLIQLSEDEFLRTTHIKSFHSKAIPIPLSHPRDTRYGDDIYSVVFEVELKRKVSHLQL